MLCIIRLSRLHAAAIKPRTLPFSVHPAVSPTRRSSTLSSRSLPTFAATQRCRMKAVTIQSFGGPEGLSVIDLPDPTPPAGSVLIEVEAIGVGGADMLILSGALAAYGFKEGYILGSEVAGTVSAVGDGVDHSLLGQRVWAFVGSGGYAEKVAVRALALIRLPVSLSSVDAVTLGGSGAVAHFALRHARFTRGESVLVRGAAGGIGVMTVQLAARAGASAVAVTTSSDERGDRLRKLGATHVLDRDGEARKGDMATAPTGYDIVLDIVAGPHMPSFISKLNPNGRMVAVGALDGKPPATLVDAMFAVFHKSLSFATFSANAACVPEADRLAVTAELFEAASSGEMQAVVHEVLPLEQAETAHQKLVSGEVFGRLVLRPSPS